MPGGSLTTSPWKRIELMNLRVPPRLRPPAFTLIEAVAAVAIVCTIAVLLVPGITSVRAAAQQAKCLSNLRQLGVACHTYAGENNGSLPPGPTWDREISVYLGIVRDWNQSGVFCDVLRCPMDTRSRPLADGKFPRSYTASVIKAADPTQGVFGDGGSYASRRLAECSTPASTIMIYEYYTSASGASIANEQFMGAYAWSSGFQTQASIPRLPSGSFYHGKTMNFLFLDGHTEALDPSIVYTPGKVLWRALPR